MENVTVADKKEFMRWFLNHHQMKKRESVWILNYIMSHDIMMEKLHFVDGAQHAPVGMVMSAHGSDTVPFRFYKGTIMTTDAEKAFHDMRLHRDRGLYITILFAGMNTSAQWIGIREENPFRKEEVNMDDKLVTTNLIENLTFERKLKELDDAIDKALMYRDRKEFMLLSEQRSKLLLFKPEKKYQTGKR